MIAKIYVARRASNVETSPCATTGLRTRKGAGEAALGLSTPWTGKPSGIRVLAKDPSGPMATGRQAFGSGGRDRRSFGADGQPVAGPSGQVVGTGGPSGPMVNRSPGLRVRWSGPEVPRGRWSTGRRVFGSGGRDRRSLGADGQPVGRPPGRRIGDRETFGSADRRPQRLRAARRQAEEPSGSRVGSCEDLCRTAADRSALGSSVGDQEAFRPNGHRSDHPRVARSGEASGVFLGARCTDTASRHLMPPFYFAPTAKPDSRRPYLEQRSDPKSCGSSGDAAR
jgi:hypothetical protein